MKKQILLFTIIIISGLALALLLSKDKWLAPAENSIAEQLTAESLPMKDNSDNVEQKIISSQDTQKEIKNEVWEIFQEYLSYNKELRLAQIKKLVYKVADVCKDEEVSEACKDRMNSAYAYGSALKKEDFKNIWSDKKQVILATDFWIEEAPDLNQYGRFRAIIFFVKQEEKWKILSFSPFKGGIIDTKFKSRNEVADEAVLKTKDDDNDGVANYIEECGNQDSSCLKTDPEEKDSDQDDWWDGVDNLL